MRGPVPSQRAVRVLVTLAVLIAVAVVAWLFFQVASLSVEAKNANRQRDHLASTVAQQGQAIDEANQKLVAAGKQPVTVPSVPVTPVIVNGLTAAQVDQIVDTRLAQRGVTLTPTQQTTLARFAAALVPKPKDGTSVPASQVQTLVDDAVAKAVAALPAPQPGPAGPAGADGKDGADAPPPTDQQVLDALTKICANNACKGTDGRGITDSAVNADGHLILTYSDGTSVDLGVVIGPPGPLCPDGWIKAERELVTGQGPDKVTETVLVCVRA